MARSSYIYVVNRISPSDGWCSPHHICIGAWTVKHEMVESLAELFEKHRFPIEVHRFRDGQPYKLVADRADLTDDIQVAVRELMKQRKKMRGKR